jgi:hypothetical protein
MKPFHNHRKIILIKYASCLIFEDNARNRASDIKMLREMLKYYSEDRPSAHIGLIAIDQPLDSPTFWQDFIYFRNTSHFNPDFKIIEKIEDYLILDFPQGIHKDTFNTAPMTTCTVFKVL